MAIRSTSMRRLCATAFGLATVSAAFSQPLSMPLDAPARPTQPAQPLLGAPRPAPGGAGYHDPRSPFAQLQEIDGVVSWKLLSAVSPTFDKSGKMTPKFPVEVRALNAKTVKVQGFMMPLQPGATQKHFLLSAVPTTCAFCVPAGPEGLIEVRAKTPVKYGTDAVMLEGKLAVLDNDSYGIFYRIADAEAVIKP